LKDHTTGCDNFLSALDSNNDFKADKVAISYLDDPAILADNKAILSFYIGKERKVGGKIVDKTIDVPSNDYTRVTTFYLP